MRVESAILRVIGTLSAALIGLSVLLKHFIEVVELFYKVVGAIRGH